MLDKIIDYLAEKVGADEGEITMDTEMFEEGLLDSFGLVQLVVWLGEQGATVDLANLTRSDISTPRKLAAMIQQ